MQGEQGAQALRDNCDQDQAIAEFKKKFKDKTKNKWEDRANFVPSPGKYTLLEMDEEEEVEEGEVGTVGTVSERRDARG